MLLHHLAILLVFPRNTFSVTWKTQHCCEVTQKYCSGSVLQHEWMIGTGGLDPLWDILVSFMFPHGPATSFHWPASQDTCWKWISLNIIDVWFIFVHAITDSHFVLQCEYVANVTFYMHRVDWHWHQYNFHFLFNVMFLWLCPLAIC